MLRNNFNGERRKWSTVNGAGKFIKKGLFTFTIYYLLFTPFAVPSAHAACTQTLSVGANIANSLSSAVAGSTVCLNSGNYGHVVIDSINKTGDVTLMSISGRTAVVDLDVLRSSHLRFQNLTIHGMYIHNQDKNITISNNTFTYQLYMNLGFNGGAIYGNANILIDGNSFDNISVDPDAYEGRLQIISDDILTGITISNNHFGGPGESDGIQNGSYGTIIGPGNVFDGIIQGNYGRHVDAYQGYGQSHTTLSGNLFLNGDTYIMAPDGGDTEIITHNMFGPGSSYEGKIQLGSHLNTVFLHNTVFNSVTGFSRKQELTQNSVNCVERDNLLVNSDISTGISDHPGESGCTNCTFDHNQFDVAGNASGTNNIIGPPTFTGGANPTTWAGYQLTANSIGHNAATDGKDMGANLFGSGTLPPSSSVCDLNNDSSTNVSDVQLCANQAIGAATCSTGDINHDSSCNVIDVQRVVNNALGGMCVTQ